jgi:hypothetical protein
MGIINEELSYMKYLLGYKKGVVISEQQTQTQPQQVSANVEIPKMPLNTVKSFKNLFVTNEYQLTQVVILKYSETTSIIVGSKGTVFLFVGALPDTNEPTKQIPLTVSKPIDPSGWNEYQWVGFINNYDNGSIPANAISQFLSSVKLNVKNSFGTLTPDKLGPAVKNDPNKLKKYQEAIVMSGINPNFKKV